MTENSVHGTTKVIGYWMSEKKSQKLNWTDFADVCRKHGYDLVKLNLDQPLEAQGPFSIILHKLTDIIARTLQNDKKAIAMIRRVEEYLEHHKEVAVLDPLENVRQLLDRSSSYRAIHNSRLEEVNVFTPTFVELDSEDVSTNLQKLETAGVTFPFICKPSVGHGSSSCHKMAIIFNEAGLVDCKPPCVAQTFINHNAVLFKVYNLGEKYYVVERPSLKNFYPCDHDTIFFDSHDVSKSDSTSSLSILDPSEINENNKVAADPDKVVAIVETLRGILGMSLFGVDIVVENTTGRHAIIDINAYPGYDGYPNFFEDLMQCIFQSIERHRSKCAEQTTLQDAVLKISSLNTEKPTQNGENQTELKGSNNLLSRTGSGRVFMNDQEDSGFDTSDSSDEKKRKRVRTAVAVKKSLERQL